MKKKIHFLAAALLMIVVTFTACKKNVKDADYATELSTQSEDQSRFANETDAVANDANNMLDNYNSFLGRVSNGTNITGTICDATVTVDSTTNPKKITITYNGANCLGNRTRTGVVVLSMPLATRWRDAGAVLTVSIQNLKITRLSDGKSITINGTKTITNFSGGRLRDLILGTTTSITHHINSTGMTVTFDDGTQRVWQIAKKRVFTGSGTNFVITTTGNTTVDGISNVSEWGTNRFGNGFVTSITQPMVVSASCGFRLTSGQVTHSRLVATGVVTFGLDANGNATSCPGTGNYYFKLVWTGIGGVVRTVILPY